MFYHRISESTAKIFKWKEQDVMIIIYALIQLEHSKWISSGYCRSMSPLRGAKLQQVTNLKRVSVNDQREMMPYSLIVCLGHINHRYYTNNTGLEALFMDSV